MKTITDLIKENLENVNEARDVNIVLKTIESTLKDSCDELVDYIHFAMPTDEPLDQKRTDDICATFDKLKEYLGVEAADVKKWLVTANKRTKKLPNDRYEARYGAYDWAFPIVKKLKLDHDIVASIGFVVNGYAW